MSEPEHYTLTVNGVERKVSDAWIGESLLYVLRERLGLPGSKGACEQGECGSCTVFVDNAAVCSCLVMAATAVGTQIATVEGLNDDGSLTDVQEAFVSEGAVQCGFCTPGMIMNALGLLIKNPTPTRDEIISGMEENLCRCGSYNRIIDAIQLAAKEMNQKVKI